MSEESTTPDLVELTRRSFAAVNRRDWEAWMGFFATDAVWVAQELQAFEGRRAISGWAEDVMGTFDQAVEIEIQDILALGGGVVFVSASIEGRLAESAAQMRVRMGAVLTWTDNLIRRVASYADIDEGRAAAERLAASTG